MFTVDVMPKPVWTYPLHYISFHSYTFYGFMQNEFEGTDVSVTVRTLVVLLLRVLSTTTCDALHLNMSPLLL
jgi:hypothetical protein